jgi:hypothetical protein
MQRYPIKSQNSKGKSQKKEKYTNHRTCLPAGREATLAGAIFYF